MSGPVEPGRKVRLCNGHPDRGGKTLPERAGRHLRSRGVTAFRMARGLASPLSKSLQVVQREIIAGQIQKGIEEHRGVAGRQDKPVAVRPKGISRIVLQTSRPKGVGCGSGPHRHARMTGFRLFNGIRRQKPDRIDAFDLQVLLSIHAEVSSPRSRFDILYLVIPAEIFPSPLKRHRRGSPFYSHYSSVPKAT